MNTYKKYCPNVFVAKCENEHKKDDTIILTTRRGKENEHIVHNFLGMDGDSFLYSITRADGFNSQERAKRKADRLSGWAQAAENKSKAWQDKSNEGADFLSLAEPIKVGHHSEKRHRALIERNHKRMKRSFEESKKALIHEAKAEYWERMANKIDLSMPDSLDFFEHKLIEAEKSHKILKENPEARSHSYSLTYAKKKVNDLKKKVNIAKKLWS